jgi:hypothetical protein
MFMGHQRIFTTLIEFQLTDSSYIAIKQLIFLAPHYRYNTLQIRSTHSLPFLRSKIYQAEMNK